MTRLNKLIPGLAVAAAVGILLMPMVARAEGDYGNDRERYRRHGGEREYRRGPEVYYGPGYYAPPPPVYYAPPPVYYAPPPVYAWPGVSLGIRIP